MDDIRKRFKDALNEEPNNQKELKEKLKDLILKIVEPQISDSEKDRLKNISKEVNEKLGKEICLFAMSSQMLGLDPEQADLIITSSICCLIDKNKIKIL